MLLNIATYKLKLKRKQADMSIFNRNAILALLVLERKITKAALSNQ